MHHFREKLDSFINDYSSTNNNSGWGNARSDNNDAIFHAFYSGEYSIGRVEMDKGYI